VAGKSFASVQRISADERVFLQPRPPFRRFFAASDGKRGVAKEEWAMTMRVRSAFDTIRDDAVLGFAAVAAGMLALWWMSRSRASSFICFPDRRAGFQNSQS